MTPLDVALAIQSIRPGALYNLRGTSVEWLDQFQVQPTDQEIQVAIVQLQNQKVQKDADFTQAKLKIKDKNAKPDDRIDALITLLGL